MDTRAWLPWPWIGVHLDVDVAGDLGGHRIESSSVCKRPAGRSCGTVTWTAGRGRIDARWEAFVMDGLGVRCVSSNPWVTAAETAEFVIALDVVGMADQAAVCSDGPDTCAHAEGGYWTGCVHPNACASPAGSAAPTGRRR